MRHSLVRTAGTVLLLLAAVATLSLAIGPEPLSIADISVRDSTANVIVMSIRMPRLLVAALVGAVLAASGATFQNLLRNSLADPFILGVSGGAACAAAAASVWGVSRSPGAMTAIAFAGATAAMLVVLALSRRNGVVDTARLLVAGLVMNSFFSAIILFVLALANRGDVSNALRWMIGSLAGASWEHVTILTVAMVVTSAVFFFIAGDLRLLAFGEDDARSRGVDVDRVKVVALVAASLATGAAVSVSGVIGFVGLLVPHLVRLATGDDYRVVLPLSLLTGATLLIAADWFARVVIAPAELPVGALLALLGVPVFIYLLWRE